MIPNQSLSSSAAPSAFLFPKNLTPPSARVSFELGGIALNDPSQGLQVQGWTLVVDELNNAVISAPNTPPTILFNEPQISEIDLAFDQNMRPFVAFVSEGIAKYFWFDTLIGEQTITALPQFSVSPRCTLDDKRPSQFATSDIILAYVRQGALYFRAQRDRYLDEYLLAANVNATIVKVGMNTANRLQFLMRRRF